MLTAGVAHLKTRDRRACSGPGPEQLGRSRT